MDKSDLVAAVANTSAISMTEAADAVEFVLHVMTAAPRIAETDVPRAANSNLPSVEQLVLFDDLRDKAGRSQPRR
ncbi:MAG: hypothetical protein OEQ29_16695 [Alphaproteobacteria bacterium]|nr:hypothetical protein [Alphaproteobacteria bacterium]